MDTTAGARRHGCRPNPASCDHHPVLVAGLWRYPVKSLRGQRADALALDARGVIGDRLWALVDADGMQASGKPSRRFRRVRGLMHHAARYDGDVPVLELADGREVRGDGPEVADAVAELAGPGWRLAREHGTPHHDAAGVHVVTTATLRALEAVAGGPVEVERLRPNVLLDLDGEAFAEDGWVGATLRLGEARLRLVERTERCVMTTHAQTGLPHRPAVLTALGRHNDACAGIYAEVLTPGATIRRGDPAELEA